MLLSYVQIANLALQHLGEDDRISDPDEASKAARTVKTAWDTTRLMVLAELGWSFASRTVTLSARPASPEWPIALGRSAYPLPPDLVNLAEILEPDVHDDDDEFAVEQGPETTELLLEHSGPVTIRYVRDHADLRDPARWPAPFVEAFAFRLAWQIADPLSAKTSKKDRAERSYYAALRKAKKSNGRTKPFRRNPESDWSRARRGHRVTVGGHPL